MEKLAVLHELTFVPDAEKLSNTEEDENCDELCEFSEDGYEDDLELRI